MQSEHLEAKEKLAKWLSDYGHLITDFDKVGFLDVFSSLQAGHELMIEEYGPRQKSDREEHFNEGAFV